MKLFNIWLACIRQRDSGNEEWTGSQPRNVISAFRERSRRIIAIFRGNSSNAFFLRSTALGKRCILHTEYFIASAWLWHLIRSSCWGMRKLTSCAHSCQSLLKLVPLFVINFRIPGHLLASLWMTSMLFVIPRPGLKRKWSGRIFVRVHSFDWPYLEEEYIE